MDSNTDTISLKEVVLNEDIHEKQAREALRLPLLRYKKNVNYYCKTLCELLYQDWDNPPHEKFKFALSIILFRLIGTLQSIKILTLKGYYYESSILSRNFFETIGLCVFLKDNPEKVEDWLGEKRNLLTTVKSFQLVRKAFRVAENKELEKITNETYGHLCDYVHGNAIVNFHTVVNIDQTEEGRKYSYQIPSRLRESEVRALWGLSIMLVSVISYVFEDNLSKEQQISLLEYILDDIKEHEKMNQNRK